MDVREYAPYDELASKWCRPDMRNRFFVRLWSRRRIARPAGSGAIRYRLGRGGIDNPHGVYHSYSNAEGHRASLRRQDNASDPVPRVSTALGAYGEEAYRNV